MYTYRAVLNQNNGCVKRWYRTNTETGESENITVAEKPKNEWSQAEIEALFKVEEKIETSTERTNLWQESD